MLENPFIYWLYRIFSIELPYYQTMDEYIDFILSKVWLYSSSIKKEAVYTNMYWLEIEEGDAAHAAILHQFEPKVEPSPLVIDGDAKGGLYYYTVDGNVTKGSWMYLSDGSFVIKHLDDYKMYGVAFVNPDFLVLKNLGKGHSRKYRFFAREQKVTQRFDWYDIFDRRGEASRLEWRDVMEVFYDLYRYNSVYFLSLLVLIGAVVLLLFFSQK